MTLESVSRLILRCMCGQFGCRNIINQVVQYVPITIIYLSLRELERYAFSGKLFPSLECSNKFRSRTRRSPCKQLERRFFFTRLDTKVSTKISDEDPTNLKLSGIFDYVLDSIRNCVKQPRPVTFRWCGPHSDVPAYPRWCTAVGPVIREP